MSVKLTTVFTMSDTYADCNLPDPREMLNEEAPDKREWKKYVKRKIAEYQERKINKKMKSMTTMKTLNELPTKLNGKLNRILTVGHSYQVNNSIILNVNNSMLMRIGKSVTPKCSTCKTEDDMNEHMLTECAALNNGLLKTQVSCVANRVKSLENQHTNLSLKGKLRSLILLPTLFNLKVKPLIDHLKETRELIHRVDNFRNLHHGERAKFLDTNPKKLPWTLKST